MDLRDQAAVLRRRWRLVAAATAIGLVLGVLLSQIRGPQYEATATLLIEPVATGTTSTVPILEPEEIATQVQVIRSEPVAKRVLRQLRLGKTPEDLLADISVEQVGDTRVVRISAVNTDAAVAAQIANGFANSYLTLRKEGSAARVTTARAQVRRQLADARERLRTVDRRLQDTEAAARQLPGVRAQLATTQQRLAEVRRRIDDLSNARDLLVRTRRSLGDSPADQQERERVNQRLAEVDTALSGAQRAAGLLADTRQRLTKDEQRFLAAQSSSERLQDMRQALLGQIAQLNADAAALGGVPVYDGGRDPLLQPASPPTGTTAPPWRNAALGGFLGLLIGFGLAFVRDRVDDAVRDEERLREVLGDVPVLGRIPHYPVPPSDRPVTVAEPHSPASESFRSLSTSVRFLLAASRGQGGATARGQVWLVTSAGQGEGKTTVATNLAVAAARFGLRVILVEADLRRPVVGSRFGLGNPHGLSDILAGGTVDATHLIDVGVNNLRVLAGGSVPPNPAELLASPTARGLLRQMTAMGDVVIVDTPPIRGVADTSELLPYADRVLLVTRRLVTRINVLEDALERIHQIGGTVAGAVFNDVDGRTAQDTYGYRVPRPEKRDPVWQRWTGSDDRGPGSQRWTRPEQGRASWRRWTRTGDSDSAPVADAPVAEEAAAADGAAPVDVDQSFVTEEPPTDGAQPRPTARLRWDPRRHRTTE